MRRGVFAASLPSSFSERGKHAAGIRNPAPTGGKISETKEFVREGLTRE